MYQRMVEKEKLAAAMDKRAKWRHDQLSSEEVSRRQKIREGNGMNSSCSWTDISTVFQFNQYLTRNIY